jgi:quercetin dioxygenase-like cupin family protein
MAYKNKIIKNPYTGQSFKFIQTAKDTSGELLEMETTYRGHSKEPVAHYHPSQDEDFKVLQGEVTVRLDGALKTLRTGDTLHIPRGMVHAMWNRSDREAAVNWQVRPALDTENLFEVTTGLAMDGKTKSDGMPGILQVALTIKKYHHVFRMARPSYTVQKIVFTLLSPIAYLLGYRATYSKYID